MALPLTFDLSQTPIRRGGEPGKEGMQHEGAGALGIRFPEKNESKNSASHCHTLTTYTNDLVMMRAFAANDQLYFPAYALAGMQARRDNFIPVRRYRRRLIAIHNCPQTPWHRPVP